MLLGVYLKKNNSIQANLQKQNKDNIDFQDSCKLFDGIEDSFFWCLKTEGQQNAFYSDGILKITGYSPEEINQFPEHINKIIFEEDLLNVKKLFAGFNKDASRNVLRLVYRIVRKDNKVSWVKENVFAERDADGNIILLKGFVAGISELKDENIKLNGELEHYKQLNASKDKFIAMLSHDLRAPFTSILGFAEILINEPNLSQHERLEFLNYINDSSQNQLQLINYLLDWSRLQTGRLKIEPVRLHAQTIIYNCISSLTGNAIRKNIDIKVNAKDTLYVQADERLLMQVINNLLSNAIKFSNEHETIEISADVFNNGLAEFVVRDYGLGISDENKNKIFKIEKIFSTEGTKGEKGTGLGLSLVKEIIEKHGGSIWFYSDPGEGSEFHFTIPCSQKVVLIVNDNALERRKIEKIIQESVVSYKIKSIENSYEALEIILDSFPSIVIISHNLPLMNGLKLVESIRKEDNNFRIPIFSIVPKISEEIIRSYENFGVDKIFQMPIEEQVFSDELQKILD